MPLLRGKPFSLKSRPENLKEDDEVFFFDLTNEVFTDYDEFFERVILCNSLLWTCECTGRSGLTFKEARESEWSVRKALRAIPYATKRAVLLLVHQTKRSRIADLCEEIMDYLKKRYQEGEMVEVKCKDKWKKAKIEKVHIKTLSKSLYTSPEGDANDTWTEKDLPRKKAPKKNDKDSLSSFAPASNSPAIPFNGYIYDVAVTRNENLSKLENIDANLLRRLKGSLTKDLLRLLLRQTCKRTTAVSDDGYWIVEPEFVEKFSLGESSIGTGPLSLNTPSKVRNKKKRFSAKTGSDSQSPAKKRKLLDDSETSLPDDKDQKSANEKKGRRNSAGKKSMKVKEVDLKKLTPSQRKKILEKNRLKEMAEKEKLKKKKLLAKEKEKERLKKEKEDEKLKRKVEKEKERERNSELRKLEAEFMKGWGKVKEDLNLEDLKELPEATNLPTKFQGNVFGDILMVVEFLNTFGAFYEIKDSIQQDITYDLIESALQEHDAEGVLYDIIKFLLQTFFTVTREENEAEDDDEDSSSDTATPEPDQEIDEQHGNLHVSSNATAAAVWSMLHQGMALEELTIDPFTLSEVLRLHVLSSGVKIGGARNIWQRKGGFQFSDDPCVDFRHREKSILRTLHTGCLYDLSIEDKLKIMCVLCNQILTLTTTRDYIEDSFEKVKELKRKLRELQNAEHKRRKLDSAERWRKRMEESARRKEEIENRKKEKEAREKEAKSKDSEKAIKESDARNTAKKKTYKQEDKREQSQSEESKAGQSTDVEADREAKKEDGSAEEKEEEMRKREEYKRRERELLEEVLKYSSIRSEESLGLDRIYNRYWSFTNVDGLLIEADEDVRILAECIGGEDENELEEDLIDDTSAKTENDSFGEDGDAKPEFSKVGLDDIIAQRHTGKPMSDLLFTKYKCKMDAERRKLVGESKIISTILEGVEEGIDPHKYAARRHVPLWSGYSTHEQLDDLISALNQRGTKELKLKTKLEKLKYRLSSKIERCSLFNGDVDVRPAKIKPVKNDVIDKTLFKSMEDFLEGNLRDQLLDFEERLWQASLGIIKVERRDKWREDISAKINDLLIGKGMACRGVDESMGDEHSNVEDFKENIQSKVENGVCSDSIECQTKMEVDEGLGTDTGTPMDDSLNSELGMDEGKDTSITRKGMPMKFISQESLKKEESRCSTPVNISTPMINPQVRLLAAVLLKIERGIDHKYLKPPIGENESAKRERIREMIEAAHSDNTAKLTKSKRDSNSLKKKPSKGDLNGNEGQALDEDNEKSGMDSSVSEEALRREITCLERWEASLNAATNFSQIFIHLNTLDRSVMWDKSVLNARCRICRKKGDAEKMLLCDGCDRGFHMYCMKPPVKKVPEGDWYCVDCRPKETKRTPRPRKRPVRLEEFVDDIDEVQSVEESYVEASEIEGDLSVVGEDSDKEPLDEHDDFCAVCSDHGDLLCCDICQRAFHINCVYPPIRKVPKGDWSCQVCTGADSDLPKARRVVTIEREREKLRKREASTIQWSSRSRRSHDSQRRTYNRKRHSSPGPSASRRQRGAKAEARQVRAHTRKTIGDPTALSSRRSDAFGRYERRLCSKIVEELISADDGVPFILPVDTKMVPDYLDFIDHPMDLSKVKMKLNDGSYDALREFIDDVRLIFANCETYNQPRSGVARAGSRLSIYFEQRLRELELIKS